MKLKKVYIKIIFKKFRVQNSTVRTHDGRTDSLSQSAPIVSLRQHKAPTPHLLGNPWHRPAELLPIVLNTRACGPYTSWYNLKQLPHCSILHCHWGRDSRSCNWVQQAASPLHSTVISTSWTSQESAPLSVVQVSLHALFVLICPS